MDPIEPIRTRLNARKGNWPAICAATGLNYNWMTKFAQGRIADPGMSKLTKLLAHLDSTDDTKPEAA